MEMEGLERFGARAFNEDELESSVIQQHFNFVQEDNLPSLLSVVAESGSLDCLLKPTSPLSNKQLNILNKLNSLTKRALQLQPQRGSAATLSRSDELCIKEQILSAVYGRAKRERQEELQLQRKNSQAKSRQRSNVEERKETPSELPTPQDTELLVRTGKLTPLDRLKGLHSSENKPERRDAKGKVSRNGQQRHDSAKASKSPWEKALSRGKRKKKKSDRGKSTVKRKKSSATANIDTKKPAASEGSACPVCQREFRLEYLEKHVEKCLSRPRVAGSEDTSEQTARGSTSASSEGGVEEERDGDEVTVDTDSDSSSALSSGSRIGGFVLQDDSSETRYKGRLRRYESAEKRWSALLKKFKEEGKTQQECFECALATVEAEEDDPGAIDITPQRGVAGSVKDEKSVEERIQSIYKKIDVVRLEGGLKIPSSLYAKLFEYQRTGIKWLSQLDTQGTGGILGDEQGLGKTCQICSFLGALKCSNRLKTSLIVCPATTLSIWVEELNRWHAPIRAYVLHSSGSAKSVAQWSTGKIVLKALQEGDVIITTYQGLRLQRSMLLPHKWGYVILDEGHKLKNPDADITLVAKQLQTTHRIIVSGTPIQNNLKELWSLFDFVYPGRLGTLPMFQNQFSIPINAGGYANASNMQVQMAYRCAMVLKESIAPYLLRRLKKDVAKQLPSKTEQVLFCNLTPAQTQLYENYLSKPEVIDIINGRASGRKGRDSGSVKQTFGLIRMLQHICNHPLLFENKRASNEGYEVDVASSTNPTFRLSTVDTLVAASGKLQVLRAILRKWRDQGHRALVFSQSKQMLSILESLMHGEGYPYLRMDGDTSVKKRGPLIARFNDKKSNLFVFLLTTKVGGVGINLTGANRVVLFDPDWNPSNDSQARERAWRIGQKKDVTIYRLITSGTIEEKIYHRQIFKQYLTNKVLLDPRQRKFFSMTSLRDLFTLGDCSSNNSGTSGSSKRARSSGETETSTLFYGGKIQGEAYKEGSNEESSLLKSLFDSDSNSMKQVFSHDAVEDASKSDPDKRIIVAEAVKVARKAAASLAREQERCARSASDIHVPTWTGQSGKFGKRFGGAGSAGLLSKMRNGSSIESSDLRGSPTSLLASLVAHLKIQPRSSQNLLATYKNEGDPHVFRELLREVATCKNGLWTIKPKYL